MDAKHKQSFSMKTLGGKRQTRWNRISQDAKHEQSFSMKTLGGKRQARTIFFDETGENNKS